jgi:hypothetical protein
MNDGGVVAITGFLYQLLGTAGGLATTLKKDPVAVVRLEPAGEDALFLLNGGATLVQFKNSATQDELTPGDLADILTKLELHSDSTAVNWRLVTNRTLIRIRFDSRAHAPRASACAMA